MKRRPILFSASMVRAILAGKKTQTRRLVDPQPSADDPTYYADRYNDGPNWAFWRRDDMRMSEPRTWKPYAEIGDRLWVKETWAAPHAFDPYKPREIPQGTRIYYAADGDLGGLVRRPSRFCMEWMSRLSLEVTGVRVERLQDISEADAIAEGVTPLEHIHHDQWIEHAIGRTFGTHPHVGAYSVLWDQLNYERASWHANPWVWALTFSVGRGGR